MQYNNDKERIEVSPLTSILKYFQEDKCMNTEERQKEERNKILTMAASAFACVCFFVLLWLRTSESCCSVREYIARTAAPQLAVLAGTILAYYVLAKELAAIKDVIDQKWIRKLLVILFIIVLLVFFTGDLSNSRPEKYLFPLIVAVVYPLLLELAFQAMEHAKFTWESMATGLTQIILFWVLEQFFFAELENVWLFDMVVANLVAYLAAADKYLWKRKEKRVSLAVMTAVYIAGMFLGFGSAICDQVSGMMARLRVIYRLDLFSAQGLHEYLGFDSQLMELLFVVILGLLLISFVKMAGFSKRRKHQNSVIFITACWMMTERIVFGLLYGCGLSSYKISIPWFSSVGRYGDTMVLALLLICAYEICHPGERSFPGENWLDDIDLDLEGEEVMEESSGKKDLLTIFLEALKMEELEDDEDEDIEIFFEEAEASELHTAALARTLPSQKIHPFLKFAAFVILLMAVSLGVESFKNYDMTCDMVDIAHEYLDEAEVRLKSKDEDCWYFILSSPELESLTEEEWVALYEATNLEHIKVVDYLCNSEVYYSADAVMEGGE